MCIKWFHGKISLYFDTDLVVSFVHKNKYGKGSKISNTDHLPKRSRQTGQTQIRLLLKKQSDQGLPFLLF